MPSVLSKQLTARILGSEWSFGYNCYEVGHTWTPSCTSAALEVSSAAAIKVIPLYGLLYTLSQLAFQRRYDLHASLETLKDVLRSSFFIFFHAYNGSLMGCALRRAFGRFYYRVLICLPALVSSYLSLAIEKPSRRQALAFYLVNMASEIFYQMLVARGYFRPIRHGETVLFALSLAAWYYYLKEHGFSRDPMSLAFQALIGPAEAKPRTSETVPLAEEAHSNGGRKQSPKGHQSAIKIFFKNALEAPLRLVKRQLSLVQSLIPTNSRLLCKHASCPHQETSCVQYVFGQAAGRFLLGCSFQSLLKLAQDHRRLLAQPGAALWASLSHKKTWRMGLFLVTLVSAGRATSCLLRHHSNSNNVGWHAPLAGLVAGSSMLWAPRSSLSMYVMWKVVEQFYLRHFKQSEHFNLQISTIYSLSAALILYAFALEPQFVRPSYMKFLDRLSDHRLHQMNRLVLDVFGTGSSVGYEDFFPDLHPKFMSNQFKELVFNWMIQPYD